MSNMAALLGSRPLEHFKVTELRDELKKRGLSLKGVKKELFERLEEALKKEEQEEIVNGEHEATLEGAHTSGTSDETEDVEDEKEVLDRSQGDAFESPDTAIECQNNTPMDSPLPSTEEPTPPFSEKTHSLPGVSAPDEVPVSNKEREQLYAEGGAKGDSNNNDVVFVDNAVCGNGGGVSLPEDGTIVADGSEPCKDTSGVEHVECGDDGKEPNSVVSELVESEKVHALPESFSAGSGMENVKDLPKETVDTVLASDNSVSANDVNGSDCPMRDVEKEHLKEDKPSTPDTIPSLEADDKSLVEHSNDAVEISQEVVDGSNTDNLIASSQITALQKVVEPHVGLESEELAGHNLDKRDLIINEEKPDVKLENVAKHEIMSDGGFEKSAVKIESMEIETGIEEKQTPAFEVKMELKNDKEDCPQLNSISEALRLTEVNAEHDYSPKSEGEESANRMTDDKRMVKRDDVSLKFVQDDSQARINLKRKDNEVDVKQEPAKRMRRWNSGKEVVVDTIKPLTTDSMKEIMLPDSAEGSSAATQILSPKTVATSRPLPAKVKVEPDRINSTRTVPPSARAPSNSLKVERFVRPFTLKAVKDLLAKFGQCVDFWMDQIKTHCFVTYSSVNEAVAARNGLYGRQWPPFVGNFLVAEFVDVNEVRIRVEGLTERAPAAPVAVSLQFPNSTLPPSPRVRQTASSLRSDPIAVPLTRFSRDIQPPPPPKKDSEPAVVTLEDLFLKTKAKPHIYYLPLTDEQVAEKLKKKQTLR